MNPVVQREFFGILRTRQGFGAIVFLTGTFSLLVLERWPSDALVDLSGSQSRQVLQVFAYGLLAGVVLVVPAFSAVSVVRERNKGTLTLLVSSPLKPRTIYLGKLAGVLLFTFLLILTSLPAAAACYAMGGIDLAGQLGVLYAILVLLAIQYTTLGLLVSSYVSTVDAGIRVTYAIVFATCFLTLGPHFIYQGQWGWMPGIAARLRCLSPIPIVMDLVGHSGVISQGLLSPQSGIREFIGWALLTSLVFAAVTLARLNYRLFDRPRPAGVITDDRTLLARVFRRMVYLVDPQRRKPSIPWLVNPVMVKEFRTRRFGRLHWLLQLVAACAVASILLTFAAATSSMKLGVETIGGLLVLLQVLLVVVITPSLAAGLISSERESGGWDLLRMTPLPAVRILSGKMCSVLSTLALVLFATIPGYLVMVYIQPVMWLQVYLVLICLLLIAMFTAILSAAVGSLFARTANATATVYGLLIILFLGPLLVWLARDAPFGHTTVQYALLATPLGAALSVIEAPGFAQYELLPASWWICGIASSASLVLLTIRTWRLMLPG